MATYEGLLYVKHGRLGTRSEGPDYYLQTSHGDYLLHFQDRDLWKPDYQLEFFCRRMVRVRGELRKDVLIQVEEVEAICEQLIPQSYTAYKVKIASDSSSEINDIELGMIGSDDKVSIESLCIGANTESYEFLLRKLENGEVPISYGDYVGTYKQTGEKKHMFIPSPEQAITVTITDESFEVKAEVLEDSGDNFFAQFKKDML